LLFCMVWFQSTCVYVVSRLTPLPYHIIPHPTTAHVRWAVTYSLHPAFSPPLPELIGLI
jgi:hypothetical protein